MDRASSHEHRRSERRTQRPFVVGVAGPRGAGKSALIEALKTFFLRLHPCARVATECQKTRGASTRTMEGRCDLVFVEAIASAEDNPFGAQRGRTSLVDAVLFVLAPDEADEIQLMNPAAFARADWIALNKCDDPRAAAAKRRIAAKLKRHDDPQAFHLTIATERDNLGVATLYGAIAERAGFDSEGGEKPCQLRIDDTE